MNYAPPNLESRRRGSPGVTLVEVLAVMIIITILMGLVLGISAAVGRKQDMARATAHLEFIERIVQTYKDEYGELPSSLAVAGAKTTGKTGELVYTAKDDLGIPFNGSTPLDPWGQPFYYQRDPNLGRFYYLLGSFGPDGSMGKATTSADKFGEGDDIQ
jgi:general secretion pathway protein G